MSSSSRRTTAGASQQQCRPRGGHHLLSMTLLIPFLSAVVLMTSSSATLTEAFVADTTVAELLRWAGSTAQIALHKNCLPLPQTDPDLVAESAAATASLPDGRFGWHLVALGPIEKGSVIAAVPRAFTLAAPTPKALAALLDEKIRHHAASVASRGAEAAVDASLGSPVAEPFAPYLRLLLDTPYCCLPASLTMKQATNCLPRHFAKLHNATCAEFESCSASRGASLEMMAVLTRAITAPVAKRSRPTDQEAEEAVGTATTTTTTTEQLLVPIIDFANDCHQTPAAVVSFQRNNVVELVALRDLEEGDEICISYGNMRSFVDMVDQYGFLDGKAVSHIVAQLALPRRHGQQQNTADGDKRKRQVLVNAEKRPSISKTAEPVFEALRCLDEHSSSHTIAVATGKPSEGLFICASLLLLKKDSDLVAFHNGTLPLHQLMSLKIRAYKALAAFASRMRKQYELRDEEPACQATLPHVLPSEDAPVSVVDVTTIAYRTLNMVQRASKLMSNVYVRLETFCAREGERLATKFKAEAEAAMQSGKGAKPPRGGGGGSGGDL